MSSQSGDDVSRFNHFRLSTAVVAMLVASALLYLNTRLDWHWGELSTKEDRFVYWISAQGWPLAYNKVLYTSESYLRADSPLGSRYSQTHPPPFVIVDDGKADRDWRWTVVLEDTGIAIAIVAAAAVASELLARRREARKP